MQGCCVTGQVVHWTALDCAIPTAYGVYSSLAKPCEVVLLACKTAWRMLQDECPGSPRCKAAWFRD